ncbi:hypothetical protein R1sor_004761 [Riccia sorocarpa]|uniref:R3H domain-containing protein n=1 Tax=Riccia sorocarpa TaxID=122646 RepID=A0ABD3HHL1_9MARC
MDEERLDTADCGISEVGCSSEPSTSTSSRNVSSPSSYGGTWRFGEEVRRAQLPRLATVDQRSTSNDITDVEELARLIKDNLTGKHFLLSMEELFVEFLECPLSDEDTLILEPMESYQRMLLHRLADLFGLAHESFGEGVDRHLVVQKCEESLIPPVLVSDVLEQSDGGAQPAQSYRQLLKRHTVPSESFDCQTSVSSPSLSLEERQAAYLAARQKIFCDKWRQTDETTAARPRADPIVARRMIAHALGKPKLPVVPSPLAEARTPQDQPSGGHSAPSQGKQITQEAKEAMQRASVKAAKRMFANALGSELSSSSTRPASREVPCRVPDSDSVSLMEEVDCSVLSPTGTRTLISREEVNASTSGVEMNGDFSDKSSRGENIILDSKVARTPASELRPVRNSRPGGAAFRIFAQALGLPDPVSSSEVGRSPAIHRGGSLSSS